VVEGGPTPAAPVDGPVLAEVVWPELVAPEDVVGACVTGFCVAAVEPAAVDGTVGAAATGDVVAADVAVALLVDELEVGVEPIVEVDPVVPAGVFAAASVVAVTI
jgi:hypothetical protein